MSVRKSSTYLFCLWQRSASAGWNQLQSLQIQPSASQHTSLSLRDVFFQKMYYRAKNVCWPFGSYYIQLWVLQVCNRARLYSKRIRSHRRADEESDLPVPEAFGQQIACDHMIVSKSSSGKEFVVLVVMDMFSKVFQAYPLATKDTDSVKEALNHFVGVKAKNPQTICKSDCAKELLKAIRSLGWLSDASLPRRWPHNSVLERQIKSFEESCRSMHLQAGFAVFPKLWTLTCQYTAVSMSIEHWSKAFGSEFKGADYILGQLVFYRTKFQEKSKLAPNSSPALMGGWELEFGCRYKGVLRLVDYNSLKQGHVSIVVAPDQEVYVRDERVFPLRNLAEKALNGFSDPDVRQLADVDPLPVPFIEDTPETKSKARRVYITYSRMLKIGPTKGSKVVMLIHLHTMPNALPGMRKHSVLLRRPQHLSLRPSKWWRS